MSQFSDRRAPSERPTTRIEGNERLAFSFDMTVPARRSGAAEPTFATAAYSEPRDWGYTGLLAFTAVLLIRPQDTFPVLSPLRLAELCALAGIAPMLLHRFARRLPVFRVTAETMGLMFFSAVMLATVPFSIWPGGAVSNFVDTFIKVLIVFVLMLNTLTTPKRLEQLTWLIVLCTGYIALRGVIDYARGANLVEGGRLGGAVGGIFGNPNDLALNMVSIMPIAAVAALSRRYTVGWRLVAAAIVLLMIATVVFTKSRSGVLGLGVVLLALLVLSRSIKPAVVVGALAASLMVAPLMPATFWNRMATILDSEEDARSFTGSREARSTLLREAWDTFLEHPITGVGAGQFENYNPPGREERWRQAHNVLLQVAADLGIFGVLALSYLIYRGIHAGLVLRRRLGPPRTRRRAPPLEVQVLSADERQQLHEHAVALSAAIIGWFVCALFASVAYSWTFYYLLALIVAAREMVRDRVTALAPVATRRPKTRHSVGTEVEPLTA